VWKHQPSNQRGDVSEEDQATEDAVAANMEHSIVGMDAQVLSLSNFPIELLLGFLVMLRYFCSNRQQ